MGKWWIPPSESPAMTMELPEEWDVPEISSEINLIYLAEMKLERLIQEADEAEETLRFFVRNLENAGILGFGMTDVEALAKADQREIYSVLENPEMTYHLVRMCGVPEGEDRLTYPLKYNSESPDNGADEVTLEDWVDEVTQGMYVPEWD